MVEKKNDETLFDFDWDKFFEDEVKNESEITNFAEVIKKYTINTKAESQEVSEKDFLNVVYKGKNEKIIENKQKEENKVDLTEAEEEFFNVINKERKRIPSKEKTKKKIENEIVSDETFYKILNKVKDNDEENKITEYENYEYKEENGFKTVKRSLFMRSFVYSSVISIIIIYALYQYVFK